MIFGDHTDADDRVFSIFKKEFSMVRVIIHAGGVALATVISWSIHHSILWAMFQGFFSWLYVIYFAITR